MLWVIGFVCCGLIVGCAVLFILIGRKQEQVEQRFLNDGERYRGWIVMANTVLFDPNQTPSSYALVVYSPDPAIADDEEMMREWIEALTVYRKPRNARQNERAIDSAMKTQIPFFEPIELPEEITNGREGYLIGVWVDRSLLPGGALRKGYINITVLPGSSPQMSYARIAILPEPKGQVMMLPYEKKANRRG